MNSARAKEHHVILLHYVRRTPLHVLTALPATSAILGSGTGPGPSDC